MLRHTTTMTGLAGTPYYSTLYSGGLGSGDAVQMADRVRTFWDSLKGFITAGLVIQTAGEVEEVDTASGLVVASYPVGPANVVSTGNAPLPKSTQGLIRWRTGVYAGGKEIRGRTFIPALANDAQLGGVPSAGFITAANNAATALRAGLLADGTSLTIYSPTHHVDAVVSSGLLWALEFAVLRSRRD